MIKKITQIVILFLPLMLAVRSNAQTTVNAGAISGAWSKAGSPYKINGDVYIPQGQTLHIGRGVKVEFQAAYTMHVWGSLQAIGAVGDSVIFTAKTIATGWKGVYMHKNLSGADSNIIRLCRFEYAKYMEYSLFTRGAIGCDTQTNLEISHCRFYKNTSNTGTCIRATRTNLKVTNCLFHYNSSIDPSTSVPSGWEPNGSAVTSVFADLIIDSCLFLYNTTAAPNDPRDTTAGLGHGVIFCYNGNLLLDHSRFEGNYSSLGNVVKLFPMLSGNKNYTIRNVDFINNVDGFDPLIQINNGGSYSGIQTNIQNCNFIGNTNKRGNYSQICLLVYLSGGSNNFVNIDKCLFYKNNSTKTRPNVLEFNNSVVASISNTRFIGNRAEAIYFSRKGKLTVFNTLFANNYSSLTCGLAGFTSDVLMYNNVFVNNALPSADSAAFKGKLYYMNNHTFTVGGPDNLNVYNSVFYGNLGDQGKLANIITENIQAAGRISVFQNNYLQGGMSSTSNNKGGQANMIIRNNTYTDTLIFVSPTTGAGPDYADTAADWHIINTCSVVPATYNKGYASIKDANNNIVGLPATDIVGNPRVQQDTVDIGIYETNGLKARTVLRSTPPLFDSICIYNNRLLKSKWDGMGLTYTWQRSQDGKTNWQNLQTADTSNCLTAPQTSAYYRVEAVQNECGRSDTSAVFFLKVRQLPQLLQAPNSDSVCPGKPVHLSSVWSGEQLIYTWETSSDGSSNWQLVQKTDSSDLHLMPVGNSYYRLRVNVKACSKDSLTKAVAVGLYPVPKPDLGKDSTINQHQILVLNPGNFSSYHWNTGAVTATISIDGATEAQGTKSYSVKVTNAYGCENSDTVNVTVKFKTRIDGIALDGLKVYPVPSNGTINIVPSDEKNYTYLLTDMQGKIVMKAETSGPTQINNVASGQYLLIIETENEVKKMIVMVR